MAKKRDKQVVSTDRPIESVEQDAFQRADFAKRVVRLIKHRGGGDCLVIGIYGAWGEGKTSVIRMIDKMLVEDGQATTFRFNPWVFKEEGMLLREFFLGLAKALDQKLFTGWDEFAKQLKRYGGLLSIGLPGFKGMEVSAEGLGELIGEVGNEELKNRLGECLKKYPIPIVIFVDDIDRLSKEEIHAVFRLVKLTGDLPNVTYVLCFDEGMVAAAIGERFGRGDIQAGRDFLEKVIQVPLRLPQIPIRGESGLQMFALSRIQEILNGCGIELNDEEAHEFRQAFDNVILPRLVTPREVLRYSNALSFTIPMLMGEVHIVDLMLFEALRVFYPEYHRFVSEERDMFIGSFDKPYSKERDVEKIDRFQARMKRLGEGLLPAQRSGVEGLISTLFPRTEEAAGHGQFSMKSWNKWLREQRIASSEYFQRYLTYSVIKGQLEDTQLLTHLKAVSAGVPGAASKAVPHLVEISSPQEFLLKLTVHTDEMAPAAAKEMSMAIAKNGGLFSTESELAFFGFPSVRRRAADAISKLIMRIDEPDRTNTLLQVIECASSFDFALGVVWSVGSKEAGVKSSEPMLDRAQSRLRERALKEAGPKPLFEVFPRFTRHLLFAWERENGKALRSYVNDALQREPTAGLLLLLGCTPDIRSSAHPEPYLTDFSEEDFKKCAACCDIDLLASSLRGQFTKSELDAEPVRWTDKEATQTDINVVRQFMHWYTKEEAGAA